MGHQPTKWNNLLCCFIFLMMLDCYLLKSTLNINKIIFITAYHVLINSICTVYKYINVYINIFKNKIILLCHLGCIY